MNTSHKQYTVGRGKLYFDPFIPGTETRTGELYFGNTPSITIASTFQDLPHYSSDDHNSFLDDDFTLRTDRNMTIQVDNISMTNVGIMWGVAPVDEVTAAATGSTSTLADVVLGRYYQLGVTDLVPDGVGKVTNVVVSNGTTVTATGNFEVDTDHGRIYILPDAADIVAGDDLTVTFDAVLQTRTTVIESGIPIEGALRYIADNRKGENKDQYWRHVKLQPSGDFQLKGDTWQTMTFTAMVMQPENGERVYIRAPQ